MHCHTPFWNELLYYKNVREIVHAWQFNTILVSLTNMAVEHIPNNPQIVQYQACLNYSIWSDEFSTFSNYHLSFYSKSFGKLGCGCVILSGAPVCVNAMVTRVSSDEC
ncbi:hypothetical protein Sjap_016005 [Stephania japonica]|uniref:Uncharacterized protein n=1 Tax=Stephania japonica TaxID=461633 RepID=A0AAP0IKB1_9MAGN